MSLHFFEGFETSGSLLGIANQATTGPDMQLRWDASSRGGVPSTDSSFLITDVFSEGLAVQMGSNGFSNGNYFAWYIPSGKNGVGASATEFIVGCRYHVPTPAVNTVVMAVYNGTGTQPGTSDLQVNALSSGSCSISRFVGGTMETVTGVFTTDTWHYVELKFTISSGSSSNGSYEVHVDGTQIMVNTAARTNGNFFSVVQQIRFPNMSGASTTAGDFVGFDDIYILEVDGTTPNDFIGASARVISLPPDADAGTNNWTTSTGTDHYALIDENGADSSDYLEESTNGDADMFDITDTVADGGFIALKVEAEAIALTTTSHTLDVRCNSNATVAETNHAVTSTTAYDVFTHYQVTDPDTAGSWTQASIDAVDVGIQFNT